jgi:phospholipid/cholesterol/gamma-HCH transport system substrate-binding protein
LPPESSSSGARSIFFSSTYQLKAQFDNVAGLAAGADVQVGGVHSGTVHSIELPHKPGDKGHCGHGPRQSTHEIIKQDSVASIETEGSAGQSVCGHLVWIAGQPK